MAHGLREWQQEALNQYLRELKENFIAVATPGAGKTTWALTVAKNLLERNDVQRVIIVVPSAELRSQWTQNSMPGVELREYDGREVVDKAGYNGIVVSYQGLAGNVGALVARALSVSPKRTLVILDEVHHAADSKSYGQALESVLGNVERRLLLTGTPWRSDPSERIPFCEFNERGLLKVDYTYGYQQAIEDGVCRPAVFPAIGADAEWVRNGEIHKANLSVNESLKNDIIPDALKTLLEPDGVWMTEIICKAHDELMSHRLEVPDAGGLVIARDKRHAERIAMQFKKLIGIEPPIVVSGEDGGSASNAKKTIDRFRRGRSPWIIAVKMISEGVDIPRLTVGIYATNVSTRMFFNQVLGRFVRVRPQDKYVTSTLFVPPVPSLWGLVQEVEHMVVHALEEVERKSSRELTSRSGNRPESDFKVLGTALNGENFISVSGEMVDASKLAQLELVFKGAGVPPHYAKNLLGKIPVDDLPAVNGHVTMAKREENARNELERLARRYSHHSGKTNQEVNRLIMEQFNWTKRGDMSVDQLERAIVLVKGWLASSGMVA